MMSTSDLYIQLHKNSVHPHAHIYTHEYGLAQHTQKEKENDLSVLTFFPP